MRGMDSVNSSPGGEGVMFGRPLALTKVIGGSVALHVKAKESGMW